MAATLTDVDRNRYFNVSTSLKDRKQHEEMQFLSVRLLRETTKFLNLIRHFDFASTNPQALLLGSLG
jgi:hypothetical protein